MKTWILLSLFCANLFSCTAFFVSGSRDSIVANTLDWFSGQGLIYINKRHVAKEAVFVGDARPLTWESRFSSVTLSQTGRDFPWNGMNESGVYVSALELLGSQVPAKTDPRPAIGYVQWMQYILDTSSDLREAIQNAYRTRVAEGTTVHYFVCDASAACGVFEYLGGRLVVHSEASLPYQALANDTYENSLDYFNSELLTRSPLEIISNLSQVSKDRFARGVLWSRGLSSEMNEVGYGFAALNNVAQRTGYFSTFWKIVASLSPKTFFVSTKAAPEVKSVRLSSFDPNCSSGVKILNLNAPIKKDATRFFVSYTKEANRALINQYTRMTAAEREVLASYPELHTRCLE